MTKVAYVTFNESRFGPSSSKRYAYLCPHRVEVGDVAVVRVSGVEKLTTVQEIGFDDPMATKTILHIIDKREHRAAERTRARREEIGKELHRLEAQQKEHDRWAALAKRNPKAKKLLAELKRLA